MADLHVSKKSIGALFNEMQGKKFIIPDYQRPYKWEIEKCDILWTDILEFYQTKNENESDYFLGTIVTYGNEGEDKEVIDGQQRITSFFLLLRAFYSKLESMNKEDDDVIGLKTTIAPCLWDINSISRKVSDFSKIHINSKVATEEDNETFHNILETGKTSTEAKDNYSKNYRFFEEKCDQFAQENPMQWKELCMIIIDDCIVLPIECTLQETALTIFSTLNDRGLPLSDSDIFKAKLYSKEKSKEAKKEFTDAWKELTQICMEADLRIDDIFRFYTHVLRGRAEEKKKEIGLRRFYAEEGSKRLYESNLMQEIVELAIFWRYVNKNTKPEEGLNYGISNESRKYLHVLKGYPNDFWRYATSVYFLTHRSHPNFKESFHPFIKELLSFLFVKFIDYPSVNAIKSDIYNSCISIIKESKLNYKVDFNEELVKEKINNHHSSRISRALLLLHAYLDQNQESLIVEDFQIEHIFPKKWQDTNYYGWEKKEADLYLDRLGNKIVFEKKLNIQANNDYFGYKKEKYNQSKIATTNLLGKHPNKDWLKNDIVEREQKIKREVVSFFKESLNR